MKKSKQLENLARKAAVLSLDLEGQIIEERVKKHLTHFKKLPFSQALPLIVSYLKELKSEIARRTLVIESVVEIAPSQAESIRKILSSRYPISRVETHINHNLLGGVRVKIGDMVYNDSLAEKINQLRRIAL